MSEMEVYNRVIDVLEKQNELLFAISKIAIFLAAYNHDSYYIHREVQQLNKFIEDPRGEGND